MQSYYPTLQWEDRQARAHLAAGTTRVSCEAGGVVGVECGRLSQRQLNDAIVAAQEGQLCHCLCQVT